MDLFSRFLAENPIIVSLFDFVRGLLIVLDILLIGIIIFSIMKLLAYKPKFVWNPKKWQKHVKKKKGARVEVASPVITAAWSKVEKKIRDGTEDSLRLAVIEADGVVDEVLKRIGLQGETFAERLGRLKPEKYSTLDALWDAHRIRNNLVHTPDYHVPSNKAEEAIKAYEAFLREIKAL